jgi:hypothetical protein
LPVASCLFLAVSTTFLLFAADSTLAKLGMAHTLTDYRWVVGLGLVISSAWLVVTVLIWLGNPAYARCDNRNGDAPMRIVGNRRLKKYRYVPTPLEICPGREIWEKFRNSGYLVFVDESFYKFFGFADIDGNFVMPLWVFPNHVTPAFKRR